MSWTVRERELKPTHSDVLSTLFCVGNGRLSTRGTVAEERHGAYRGVYMSGLYTRAPWGLVYFMGAPDWLTAFVEIDGARVTAIASERVLDMKLGTLTRSATIEQPGLRLTIEEERFASLANPNLVAQRFSVTVLEGTKAFDVVVGIDAEVRNHKAKYYSPGQFPLIDETGLKLSNVELVRGDDERLIAVVKARSTPARAAASARVRQVAGPKVAPRYIAEDGIAGAVYRIDPSKCAGQTLVFEKICALTADLADAENALEDNQRVFTETRELTYAAARQEHVAAMAKFWDVADVQIDGDDFAQLSVRFAIWSTRIAAPDDGGASSVGAKNLTSDWYRGAVFWDMEMFQLPLLACVDPKLARNHVLYRAKRLGSAKVLAAQDGYDGARYPWHSYSSGLEEPPQLGGFLYQRQHVNLAVAWGILHYYNLTGDREFLLSHGLETLVELCRFWVSRATRDAAGAYHISGVCGPDEHHPNATDNVYTNVMVKWLLRETLGLLGQFGEWSGKPDPTKETLGLLGQFGEWSGKPDPTGERFGEADHAKWTEIAERLHVPMLREGVLGVCQGYNELPEPNDALEGLGTDNRSKQADTLMVFQAIPEQFPRETMRACFDEYAPLSLQTSSLSLSTHALLAIRLGLLRDAMRFFHMTTGADLNDVMGNTRDGIHAAAQGGIWMACVWGFGGLSISADGAGIDPMLPPSWRSLKYQFIFQGQTIAVTVLPNHYEVRSAGTKAVTLRLSGKRTSIAPGQTVSVPHSAHWQLPSLQAVIFDLDGVLVSTDRFHYLAWKELADELGIPFDEEVNHKLRGVSRENSLKIIYGDRALPPADVFAAQCARKNARYVELVNSMMPKDVLPGSRELLESLRKAGIKIGIASASKNCRAVMEKTDLLRYVDAISDGTNIKASKPDPAVFFVASQRLRVLPWNCIGVEDAATGIESIHRSGMAALGIGAVATGADVTVPDVSEVTVELLRDLFASHQSLRDPYLERSLAHINYEVQAGYAATMSFGVKR